MPVFRAQPAGNLIKNNWPTSSIASRENTDITQMNGCEALTVRRFSWVKLLNLSVPLFFFVFPSPGVGNNVLHALERIVQCSGNKTSTSTENDTTYWGTREKRAEVGKSEVHLRHSRHPKWLSAGVSAASTSWTQSERKTDNRGDYLTVQRATLFCHQKKKVRVQRPPCQTGEWVGHQL